ncbi:MAG: DUF4189 domain-containing protein [Pseudomonadota bacterium]
MRTGHGFWLSGAVWRRVVASVSGIVVLSALAPSSEAFVLMRPNSGLVNEARSSAASLQPDFSFVPRWTQSERALVDDGTRGLGGGLEYAFDPAFCDRLRFVDRKQPSCAAIKGMMREAFDRWTEGTDAFYFSDVSGLVVPRVDQTAKGRVGVGAEVDLFVLSASEYRRLARRGRSAYTAWRAVREPVRLTNGLEAEGPRLMSADVVFKADQCWYFDPQEEQRGCSHFGSSALHEVAHVLGLAHADEYPGRNIDTDSNPFNAVSVSCENPGRGFVYSDSVDVLAIASRSWGGPGRWHRGLRNDDLAGRDFLYPDCHEAKRLERTQSHSPVAWGALARDGAGNLQLSTGHRSSDAATRAVRQSCLAASSNCERVTPFFGCFAFANNERSTGWAVRDTRQSAARMALAACEGGACRVTVSRCAAGDDPLTLQ